MKLRRFRLFAPFAAILALTACVTPPPLSDHITLVPVSDRADIQSGLTMNYFYGSHQISINQVACHADGSCLYGGHAYSSQGHDAQLDSLVIRTSNELTLDWARTYQIEDIINNNIGMIATTDGGALLYGNSLLNVGMGLELKPTYVKIDARGNPKWGGSLDKGQTKIFTSFTNGIRLSDGGYALAGSSKIDGQWRGTLLRLDSAGRQTWFTSLDDTGQVSFLLYLLELPNKHILGVGYNKTLDDMTLYDVDPGGRLVHSWILRMPGSELPVGFSQTDAGPVIIVSMQRPNGEKAGLLLRLNREIKLASATLYRYSSGFDPNNLVVLPNQELCLFGPTASQEDPQSLAFTTGSAGQPLSAIALKGKDNFVDGTLLSPGKIIFGGSRDIGTDQRGSGLVVTWTPGINNDPTVLSRITQEKQKLELRNSTGAEQQLTSRSVIIYFRHTDMASRLVPGD